MPLLVAQHLLRSAQLSKGASRARPPSFGLVLSSHSHLCVVSLAGDLVVQNNASSTVGQAVIQLASKQGLKTLNIMPAHSKWAELVGHMQALGATTVVADAQAGRYEFITKVLADMPAAKLGLNSAGGAAASAVARALAPGSTMVTFGSASGKPVTAPLSWFTSRELTLKGFDLAKQTVSMPKADLDKAVQEAVSAVACGSVKLLVAREPFKDFPVALKRALTPEERKVVLTF